jgi:leader peptidase (prepilin peptidase) / N-methyltransferase
VSPGPLLVGAAALATALVTAGLVRPTLRWLPEPEGEDKVAYAELAGPRFVWACIVCSAVAAALAWTTLPAPLQPLWSVLAVGGVLLAAVDAATTWLPLPLVQLAWLAMTVATLAGASLAGSWALLVRAGFGAALAGGLYLVVWLVSRGGFGFGDVRFAPLLGAAAAAHSWPLLLSALVAGTLLGGLYGVLRLLRRQRGSFAYAPAMLGGCYVAALARWLGS